MSAIEQEHFVNNLLEFLDETFDKTHGIYLDKDTSIFGEMRQALCTLKK